MRFPGIMTVVACLCLAGICMAEDSLKEIDQVFQAYDKPGSPGCSLGVIRNGDFVYRRGYGLGSLELNVPLSSTSVFYMGSVSKQFTAASVVLAAEQGRLLLDDDVRKYIPALPDYGHVITLREMLHHTSGFRDFLSLFGLADRDAGGVHQEAELIDLIARQKALNNVPGEEYIYSNTNYFLLGVVIRRATGKSLAEFANENIFRPLGMTHTRFYDDHTLVMPGRVAAYATGSDGSFKVDWSTEYDTVGGGGLMSSVDDLLLWDKNFYENKLGTGTLVRELEMQGRLNNGRKIDYALGLEISSYRGLPIVEHSGALDGYRTEILRFPDQRFSVVTLCNVANANVTALARKVADVYLGGALHAEESTAGAAADYPDPSRFAGKYLDPKNQFVYTFEASGNTLKAWGSDLRRLGPNQFHDLGTGVITFEESGSAMQSTLVMDGNVFFKGDRVTPPHLGEADLTAYEGKYLSTEINATYQVEAKNGSLEIRLKWNPPIKLEPLAPDEFECQELGTIVFKRDAQGRIPELRVYDVRARGIEFDREK